MTHQFSLTTISMTSPSSPLYTNHYINSIFFSSTHKYLLVIGHLCDFVHQSATGSPCVVRSSFTYLDLYVTEAFGEVFPKIKKKRIAVFFISMLYIFDCQYRQTYCPVSFFCSPFYIMISSTIKLLTNCVPPLFQP
jgi:hypothetical protein